MSMISDSSSSSEPVSINIFSEKKEYEFIENFKSIAAPLENNQVNKIQELITMPDEGALYQLFYLTTLNQDLEKLPIIKKHLGILEATHRGRIFQWLGRGAKGVLALTPLLSPWITSATGANSVTVLAGLIAGSWISRDVVDYALDRLVVKPIAQRTIVILELQRQFDNMAGRLLELFSDDNFSEFSKQIIGRIDPTILQKRMLSVIHDETITNRILGDFTSVLMFMTNFATPETFYLRTYSPAREQVEKIQNEFVKFRIDSAGSSPQMLNMDDSHDSPKNPFSDSKSQNSSKRSPTSQRAATSSPAVAIPLRQSLHNLLSESANQSDS